MSFIKICLQYTFNFHTLKMNRNSNLSMSYIPITGITRIEREVCHGHSGAYHNGTYISHSHKESTECDLDYYVIVYKQEWWFVHPESFIIIDRLIGKRPSETVEYLSLMFKSHPVFGSDIHRGKERFVKMLDADYKI